MKVVKLVYQDADSTKVLRGEILEQTPQFITILTSDGVEFQINSSRVISMKQLGGTEGD